MFSLAVKYWWIRIIIKILIILPCDTIFKNIYFDFKKKMYNKLFEISPDDTAPGWLTMIENYKKQCK